MHANCGRWSPVGAFVPHTGHRVVISYYTFMRFVMKVSITIFIAIMLRVSQAGKYRLTFYSVKNSKAPKPTKRSRDATITLASTRIIIMYVI